MHSNAGLDGLLIELFIVAPAITTDLVLPLVRKPWKSETFPWEWRKRMRRAPVLSTTIGGAFACSLSSQKNS